MTTPALIAARLICADMARHTDAEIDEAICGRDGACLRGGR